MWNRFKSKILPKKTIYDGRFKSSITPPPRGQSQEEDHHEEAVAQGPTSKFDVSKKKLNRVMPYEPVKHEKKFYKDEALKKAKSLPNLSDDGSAEGRSDWEAEDLEYKKLGPQLKRVRSMNSIALDKAIKRAEKVVKERDSRVTDVSAQGPPSRGRRPDLERRRVSSERNVYIFKQHRMDEKKVKYPVQSSEAYNDEVESKKEGRLKGEEDLRRARLPYPKLREIYFIPTRAENFPAPEIIVHGDDPRKDIVVIEGPAEDTRPRPTKSPYLSTPPTPTELRFPEKPEDGRIDRPLSVYSYVDNGLALALCIFGISNIIQFPFLTYKHGGVIFIFFYMLMVGTLAFPLLYLEVAMGRLAGLGLINFWGFRTGVNPMFLGIGISMVLNNVLLAGSYLGKPAWGFQMGLEGMTYYTEPTTRWISCHPECPEVEVDCSPDASYAYGTEFCHEYNSQEKRSIDLRETWVDSAIEFYRGAILQFWSSGDFNKNGTNFTKVIRSRFGNETIPWWPPGYFYNTSNFEEVYAPGPLGAVNEDSMTYIMYLLIVTYPFLVFELRNSLRICWVTTPIALAIVIAALLYGFATQNSGTGIAYILFPFDKRKESWFMYLGHSWMAASIQALWSASIGFGIHQTYAKDVRLTREIFSQCYMVLIVDGLLSFLAVLMTGSCIGTIAYINHNWDMATTYSLDMRAPDMTKGLKRIFEADPDLLFELVPRGIGYNWGRKTFVVILYFFALSVLSVNNLVTIFYTLWHTLRDLIPFLYTFYRCKWMKILVIPLVIIPFYFIHRYFTHQRSIYLIKAMEEGLTGTSWLIIILAYVAVCAWLYGADIIYQQIEDIGHVRPHPILAIAWKFYCPIILIVLIVLRTMHIMAMTPRVFGVEIPTYSKALMFHVNFIPCLPILMYAITRGLIHFIMKMWCSRSKSGSDGARDKRDQSSINLSSRGPSSHVKLEPKGSHAKSLKKAKSIVKLAKKDDSKDKLPKKADSEVKLTEKPGSELEVKEKSSSEVKLPIQDKKSDVEVLESMPSAESIHGR